MSTKVKSEGISDGNQFMPDNTSLVRLCFRLPVFLLFFCQNSGDISPSTTCKPAKGKMDDDLQKFSSILLCTG